MCACGCVCRSELAAELLSARLDFGAKVMSEDELIAASRMHVCD